MLDQNYPRLSYHVQDGASVDDTVEILKGYGDRISAEITNNPHNQTLSVAIQWGLVGVLALYAMWLSHVALFWNAGWTNWAGFLIVVQNIVSSLFNSHLSDFGEGWIYVLGVGVSGGMLLCERSFPKPSPSRP